MLTIQRSFYKSMLVTTLKFLDSKMFFYKFGLLRLLLKRQARNLKYFYNYARSSNRHLGQLRLRYQWRLRTHSLAEPDRRSRSAHSNQTRTASLKRDGDRPQWRKTGRSYMYSIQRHNEGDFFPIRNKATRLSKTLYCNRYFIQALQTSALALKHRANPNLSQRIICFVASTITDSLQELRLVCKKMKKNGIVLDLIGLGDLSDKQKEILQVMH